MLIMKKGMPVKSDKTTEALKKVVELLSNNKSVLYVSNELSHKFIYERITEITNNQELLNNFYSYNGVDNKEDLERLIKLMKTDESIKEEFKNVSIIVDIGKDVSDLEFDQDLYVYYQTSMK